jgi:SAM-dependent methyltransferase
MSREIREKIDSFEQWHYQFDLQGELTSPVRGEKSVLRHAQRKRHFFDPLVALCGGSLKGKRVLDLGCNAGFWSLNAIEAGCDFVLGIDGRQMHIDQANFVFQTKDIDPTRYRFEKHNLFDLDFSSIGSFDIVLCLGLLYHVNRPIELFEKIAAVNDDLLVIDTAVDSADDALLRLVREPLDDPRNSADYELVFWPTRSAVCEMVELFGYQVVMLVPDFEDYRGLEDFKAGGRRVFFCSRSTDLSRLAVPIETIKRK